MSGCSWHHTPSRARLLLALSVPVMALSALVARLLPHRQKDRP